MIFRRATKARIKANCLVAVILIIASQILVIIESLEVPKILNLIITLFLETNYVKVQDLMSNYVKAKDFSLGK